MSPRWATTGVFFVNGAVIGTWVAQIPWIRDRFDLTSGQVGVILMGGALAVILALPFAGRAIVKHGSRRMTWAGGIACTLAVNLTVLAPEWGLVVGALFVVGASSATMDVAMNSHGSGLEEDLGRPLMSSLHAGWSFGGMTGAAFAALLTALGVDARVTVAISSVLLLVAVLAFAQRMGPGSEPEGAPPAFALPTRPVMLIALLCLLIMVTEGAIGDWGGLYLRRDLDAAPALAPLAFAFFTAGMTAGRLVGDQINRRIGPVALLRAGALLTAVPLAAMLLIGEPAAALAGMFLIGLGVANGVPLMFSAAGRQPDAPAGPSIAAVSSMGSLGFLAGPPFIGFMADTASLAWALSVLVLGAVAVFVLAHRAVARTAVPAQ